MKYQYLVVVGIFLIILYGSLFLWLFNEWMNNPYYSHGLLIPFICFFLLFLKKDNIKKSLSPKETVRSTSEKNSFFADDQTKALLFLSAGIFLYFIGFFQAFAFLMMCSFLLVIMGIILYFSNTVLLSLVWFPIIYFIFAIPLPFVFLSQISLQLQSIALIGSSSLLQLFGFTVKTVGSEIYLEHLQFYIGLPCSGIYSLIALIALTTLFISFLGGKKTKKVLLLLFSIPLAIIVNLIRVLLIMLIAYYLDLNVAMNFFHDFSSPFLFILSFLLLMTLAKIIGCNFDLDQFNTIRIQQEE